MQVWHMSGAGNDFMVIDARGLDTDFSVLSKTLCARTHADGFMAVADSQTADFKLLFYNSDGSRGEMCGNGSRCVCRFAYDHKIAGEHMVVETDAGLIYAQRLHENEYRVKLNLPGVLELDRLPGTDYVELGNPGVPHAVREVSELSWNQAESLQEEFRTLCHHPAFPKGANVSFYTRLGDGHVRVLTYERFVEDYTLACGTGCASIAVAMCRRGLLPGGNLTAENRGGILHIHTEQSQGQFQAIYLQGPVEILEILEI